MTKKYLYPIWGAMYVICAYLGLLPEQNAVGKAFMTAVSVLFFVPGFCLLGIAISQKNKKDLKYLRLISGIILGLTLLALVGNILSIMGSITLGNVLHVVLVLVSVPMMCGQYWALSLFLWAVLFMATFPKLWPKNL